MDVKKINSKQNFTSAYACVNGKWINLARKGKAVSTKAIRQNVEMHSLDFFIKSYKKDEKGIVHVVKDKEFNSVMRPYFNEYKKNKNADFMKLWDNADQFVNYHEINSTPTQLSDAYKIYLILTGKEAGQVSLSASKEAKGKFVRNLFEKANVNLGKRSSIKYDCASKMPENVPMAFKQKHGLAWYEAARANEIIKAAKEDAEITLQMMA